METFHKNKVGAFKTVSNDAAITDSAKIKISQRIMGDNTFMRLKKAQECKRFCVFAAFFGHWSFRLMRRLDQLLANLGYCSRREARDFLKKQAVTVKGRAVRDPSGKAHAADVLINGEPLDHPDGLLLLLHKPLGLVCSHDEREGPRVYDLLPERWRARNPQITSIGRLDKDTSGLILLTDQTELVHKYTSPKHKVPKLYRATVDRDLSPDLAPLFAAGTLVLDGEDTPCAPAELRILDDLRTADLVLTEGKYHQVRRMFAATGATVLTLHRVQFGRLTLGDLAPGEFRTARETEI